MSQSSLERDFAFYWLLFKGPDGPDLTAELRFAPPRRWRFDFAHEGARVAVELQGGIWTRGRHSRGAGLNSDCEKFNEAQHAGWRVYLLTADMLCKNPKYWCNMIADAISQRLARAATNMLQTTTS